MMSKKGLPRSRERFEAVLYTALQNAAPGAREIFRVD